MPSVSETALQALFALLQTVTPAGADVRRMEVFPQKLGPGGNFILRDGDAGEPDVTFGVRSYQFQRTAMIEVAISNLVSATRSQILDDFLVALDVAIQADPTLGGIVDWCQAQAPMEPEGEPFAAGALSILVPVLLVYESTSPIG